MTVAMAGALLAVAVGGPAAAQGQVDLRSGAASGAPQLEVVKPGPAPRDISRPRETDFYREDIRVQHDPAFIEPLAGSPASGPVKRIGLSAWTSPPGRGSAVAQHEVSGWFGFGLSLIWE